MFIALDPDSREHQLHDAENFTSFSVVVPSDKDIPLPPEAVPHDLGQLTADGEHIFVRRDAVVALAGTNAAKPEWQQGFAAMVAYAESAGWLTPDGESIRAHCTASKTGESP